VTFTHGEHAPLTFGQFEQIRRDGHLCDVRLRVGDAVFSAHRIVLAATVPYFRAMFTGHMREANMAEIVIGGSSAGQCMGHASDDACVCADGDGSPAAAIDADTMDALLQYAYTGRVRIGVRNVQSLMLGAAYLSLTDIVHACGKYLQQRLHAANVLSIRSFAMALNSPQLIRAADRYIQKHFMLVSRTDEFTQLPIDELLNVLQRDELHVNNEEQVCRALRVRTPSAGVRGGHALDRRWSGAHQTLCRDPVVCTLAAAQASLSVRSCRV
jgi:hypothetical protein